PLLRDLLEDRPGVLVGAPRHGRAVGLPRRLAERESHVLAPQGDAGAAPQARRDAAVHGAVQRSAGSRAVDGADPRAEAQAEGDPHAHAGVRPHAVADDGRHRVAQRDSLRCQATAEVSVSEAIWSMTTRSRAASSGASSKAGRKAGSSVAGASRMMREASSVMSSRCLAWLAWWSSVAIT